MDYTIVKKDGSAVQFSTDLTAQAAADLLREGARGFTLDLVRSHDSGRITRNQTLWLLLKAEEKRGEVSRPRGKFYDLVSRLAKWQEGAKGNVILRLQGVRVKVCNNGGPNQGAVYVYNQSGSKYVGKIDQGGNAHIPPSYADMLASAADDPVAAAREYGHITKHCSCCGIKLSDPISIFGGIGPICLEKLAGKGARKALELEYKVRREMEKEG
jgi:hypothetical protein